MRMDKKNLLKRKKDKRSTQLEDTQDEKPSSVKSSKLNAGNLQASTVKMTNDIAGLRRIDLVQLYSPKHCLRCVHLLELPEEEANDLQKAWGLPLLDMVNCHYSNGNTACPAGTLRIVPYSDVEKAVDAYVEAFNESNFDMMTEITMSIDSKDKRTRDLVLSRIKQRITYECSKVDDDNESLETEKPQ